MKTVTAKDLSQKAGKVNIIDVRSRIEYFIGKKAPGSKNIPMFSIMGNPEKYLDKSKEYYIVCASGGRSMQVCQTLSSKGYKVVNVLGGMSPY